MFFLKPASKVGGLVLLDGRSFWVESIYAVTFYKNLELSESQRNSNIFEFAVPVGLSIRVRNQCFFDIPRLSGKLVLIARFFGSVGGFVLSSSLIAGVTYNNPH